MDFFSSEDVPMALLRERAFNLRWATLPEDVIALTAADPDFRAAPPIIEAITRYAAGGVFSYGPAEGLPDFREACAKVVTEHKGYPCNAAQILAVDSAAAGMLHIARMALTPGDEAIVFDPVDFLFKASVEAVGASVKLVPMDAATGQIDFDRLASLVTPRTRLLGVCNPHNPIGRVLTEGELTRLGAFAVAHDLVILNDEIWSDIVYGGRQFVSLPSLAPEIAARTYTVHGFSKTFGLAGLRVGFVVAPDEAGFRALLAASLASTTMTGVSTLSQVAATAAYEHAWPWAEAFVRHLEVQRDLGVAALRSVAGVTVRPPEGTYVLFPNVSHLGKPVEVVCDTLRERFRVAVVPGAARWFGPGASGHIRLVFSTSEGIWREGLRRVCEGLESLAK
jgi:aspartate/methionine/tyrosine aminotransferase